MIYKGIERHIAYYLMSAEDDECKPRVKEGFMILSAKPLDLRFLLAKLKGYRTARYWTGNDSWKYENVWHYRLRAKVTNWFVDQHYFLADHLKTRDLKGITRLFKSPLEYVPLTKRFVAIYYDVEMTFHDRYGLDIISRLKDDFKQIIWLAIKPGSYSLEEMIYFYQSANLMVRPSRWDGEPLMVREAIHFGLPVISTFGSQQEVIRCDVKNYEDIRSKVRGVYEAWQSGQSSF